MKVSSKIYKGIEYVQLSELPTEQKEKFSQCITEDTLIKILIGEKIVNNCIQYKEYELWFENVYKTSSIIPAAKIERVKAPAKVAVALGKI